MIGSFFPPPMDPDFFPASIKRVRIGMKKNYFYFEKNKQQKRRTKKKKNIVHDCLI